MACFKTSLYQSYSFALVAVIARILHGSAGSMDIFACLPCTQLEKRAALCSGGHNIPGTLYMYTTISIVLGSSVVLFTAVHRKVCGQPLVGGCCSGSRCHLLYAAHVVMQVVELSVHSAWYAWLQNDLVLC
jgi:hypothetical protein